MVYREFWDATDEDEEKPQKILTLEQLAQKDDFTDALITMGPEIIKEILAEYGMKLSDKDLTIPVFIFNQESRQGVAEIIGHSTENLDGQFVLELGIIYIFIYENIIRTIEAYFHEYIHQLGDNINAKTENYDLRITGYLMEMNHGDGKIERGEFLEETITDYLAIKMAQRFLERSGNILTEEEIIEISGSEAYAFFNEALEIIWLNDQEIELRMIQARFNRRLLGKLRHALTDRYGQGALRILVRANFNVLEIAKIVFYLTRNRRN
ncbi:MAG TPA: hypothetical protein VLH19_05340 [Patescibacteria group bacterium]|nr:hypothetical protein [Patescibacteria group bacterium]